MERRSKGVQSRASRQAGCSQITLHSMAARGRGQAAGHSPQAERKDTPQLLQHHTCRTQPTEMSLKELQIALPTLGSSCLKPGPFL